jgi:hypothetical protein
VVIGSELDVLNAAACGFVSRSNGV